MSNYRPTAVLTSFCKVLEKVMYEKLWQHINNNNVKSQQHYHFQRSSSTERATHKLINEILQSVNNKMPVGSIFCDLQKAFYCIIIFCYQNWNFTVH
jgi:hypothetical protein